MYQRRDTEALAEHCLAHLDAMTREQLHDKSAIAAELAWRDARIAELEAIVAKLPKTADGMPVVPQVAHVWYVHPTGKVVGFAPTIDDITQGWWCHNGGRDPDDNWTHVTLADAYSTRQAAEAARVKGGAA
jgi:hypothetical protein